MVRRYGHFDTAEDAVQEAPQSRNPLLAAAEEFARNGLKGTRIREIG